MLLPLLLCISCGGSDSQEMTPPSSGVSNPIAVAPDSVTIDKTSRVMADFMTCLDEQGTSAGAIAVLYEGTCRQHGKSQAGIGQRTGCLLVKSHHSYLYHEGIGGR